jgi:hypothetical protein
MQFIHLGKPITVSIYEDDTIEMACYKIANIFGCTVNDVYLYSKQYRSYTAKALFSIVNKPFKKIDRFHYHNFLSTYKEVPSLEDREYTEEDFEDLKEVLMEFPIGQTMDAAVNPEKVEEIERYIAIEPEQHMQKLLLDYMPFFENKVYVVIKPNGADYYFKHGLPIVELTSKGIDEMFKLDPPPLLSNGIVRIVCRVDAFQPMLIPLDMIFNLLHVSEDIPMIQYNSGSEDTILYKLFSTVEDIHGNKIPVLEKSKILIRDQSFKQSVTVLFKKYDDSHILKYAFTDNGSIILELTCDTSTIAEVDALLKTKEPILHMVSDFMHKSGYDYPVFTSIQQTTVLTMDYTMNFLIPKDAEDKECTNQFFIDMNETHDNSSIKRYRRVSQFSESDLVQEIFNQILKTGDGKKLKQIFHYSDEKISEIMSSDPKRKFKKAGFPTTVTTSSTNLIIQMSSIKSIYYIPSIQKNMNAYAAILISDKTISCKAPENRFVNPYDEDELVFEAASDSESDSESESEDEVVYESGSEDETGGAKVKNLDLFLKSTDFRVHRIKQSIPDLPQSYVRDCKVIHRPIALQEEEEKAENVKDYAKLSHNGKTFICPRYWDMEHHIPLTKEQLVGKTIIDPKKVGTKEVDLVKDGTVYELNDGTFPYPKMMTKGGPCCYKLTHDDKKEKDVSESTQYVQTDTTRMMQYRGVAHLPKSVRYLFELKENCMLEEGTFLFRYGVKPPHHFLDCIEACTLFTKDGLLTREKTIDGLMHTATERFGAYNNGNLIQQFKTVENFRKVLITQPMDYTYLWEIISDYFNVNLVILKVTTSLDIICPTNYYSHQPFDKKKRSLILLEQSGFEPIVEHNKKKNTHQIFHSYTNIFLKNAFDQIITIYSKCRPVTLNKVSFSIYENIKDHCKVLKQVVDNHKCIGFSADHIFIPCYPSSVVNIEETDIPIQSFERTEQKLKEFSSYVPCNPIYKVVEDNEIIGLLTETNSFVPCATEEDHSTKLPAYDGHILYEYDPIPDTKDEQRLLHVAKLTIEKNTYAECRRILKTIMSQNAELRKQLNAYIKLKKVSAEVIQRTLKDHVVIVDHIDPDIIKTTCKELCFMEDKLILPKINLLTGKTNQYFARLADELNHYVRLASFVVSPQLLIPTVPFASLDHELILMRSMVEEYFTTLADAKKIPEYYTTYDNANPKIIVSRAIAYFNVIKMHKIVI